jgi:hypothetical protein
VTDLPHPSGQLTTNDEALSLPGMPGSALASIWSHLTAQERAALRPHLLGSTSAEWLSRTLTAFGFPISATTIRTYRRSVDDSTN